MGYIIFNKSVNSIFINNKSLAMLDYKILLSSFYAHADAEKICH